MFTTGAVVLILNTTMVLCNLTVLVAGQTYIMREVKKIK